MLVLYYIHSVLKENTVCCQGSKDCLEETLDTVVASSF